MHELKLFVTGNSPISASAIANFTRVADAVLRGRYRLEVVDVLRQPRVAAAAGVLCTPMLVKTRPGPEAWFLGDPADEARLARVLMPGHPGTPSVNVVEGKLVRTRELAAALSNGGDAHASARKPRNKRSSRKGNRKRKRRAQTSR